jgi:hypothetical protein
MPANVAASIMRTLRPAPGVRILMTCKLPPAKDTEQNDKQVSKILQR